MASALLLKSARDLSKKKARTFFTVLTIALGVTGISLLGVSPLINSVALRGFEEANNANIQVMIPPTQLNETHISELGHLDNVNYIKPKVIIGTKIFIGERKNYALIIGLDSFEGQKVDKVNVKSGEKPGYMEVLVDKSNSVSGLYNGKTGDILSIVAANSTRQDVKISGVCDNCELFGVTTSGTVVLFAGSDTVRALGNMTGYNVLAFDLKKTDDNSLRSTTESIRAYLAEHTAVKGFLGMPSIRKEGTWPGEAMLQQLVGMVYVLVVLTLFCSVFLISNTMNTLILEQRKEIAQMKAIGATKRQVFGSYLTTACFIAIIGSVVGVAFGSVVVYGIIFTMSAAFGFSVPFVVHPQTLALAFISGLGIVILSSLPALYRSANVNVREGLEGLGLVTQHGKGILEKATIGFDSLPRSVHMGIRNASRKKGRSITTVLQVALAVGIFLGLIAFGYSLNKTVGEGWAYENYDIRSVVQSQTTNRSCEEIESVLANIPGISEYEPFMQSTAKLGDLTVYIMGYAQGSKAYKHDLTMRDGRGRWLEDADYNSTENIMVIGPAIAKRESIKVGDDVELTTGAGAQKAKVVGIDGGIMNNGRMVFMPLSTAQRILAANGSISGYFIRTSSKSHGDIDRISTEIEDGLLVKGYVVNSALKYVMEAQNQAMNKSTVDIFSYVSLIIVFISMIGLLNTFTMNVVERTKEIGMLRCIGARTRDIRVLFSSEAALLTLSGWAVSLPFGYLFAVLITQLIADSLDLEMKFYFPIEIIFYSLIVVMVGALLIIQAPILRATRYKPGDALRYE